MPRAIDPAAAEPQIKPGAGDPREAVLPTPRATVLVSSHNIKATGNSDPSLEEPGEIPARVFFSGSRLICLKYLISCENVFDYKNDCPTEHPAK